MNALSNVSQQPLVERMHARIPSIPMTPMDMLSDAVQRGADLATIKELMALRKEYETEEARKVFDIAMSHAQAEMTTVATDKDNSQTKSRYASYAALDRAIRPAYTKHGFSLSFNTDKADDPICIRIVCEVAHNGNYTKKYHIDMPADGKGAKGGDVMTKTHATGSATRYGMRYLLMMIFNIAVGDMSDDDGQAAGKSDAEILLISRDQLASIQSLIVETGADIAKFCTFMGVEAIPDIRASEFRKAMQALEAKRAKQ